MVDDLERVFDTFTPGNLAPILRYPITTGRVCRQDLSVFAFFYHLVAYSRLSIVISIKTRSQLTTAAMVRSFCRHRHDGISASGTPLKLYILPLSLFSLSLVSE
jgi:hypothetical protein